MSKRRSNNTQAPLNPDKKRKMVRRASDKLALRITAYNDTCKARSDNGRGHRKPGSLKMRSN